MKKIQADQRLPYKLMKNKLLYREKYKKLLNIVNKNIQNINPEEVIQMFKKLSDTGCSCAMLANTLVEQIYTDDLTFYNTFKFSILEKDAVDCNKLMVDIFSKLYGVMKIRFIEYKRYSFTNMKEASLELLGKNYNDDSQASLDLFNNGFIADGFDINGNLIFKSKNPSITNYIGTCSQVAKQKFGVDGINNIDKLKDICLNKNIELECKDIEIYEKLTGLGKENFEFWCNYYLSQYNINFTLNIENINIKDFNENYNLFMEYVNGLQTQGYSISVSSTANSQVYMHTNKPMSWSKISSEKAGHVMQFKYFNKNKDIIVSSYGEDYIIPKEYFSMLEFKKIKKISKESELSNQKMSR